MSNDTDQKRANAFEQCLIAGMMDAAVNRTMTQLKTQITPEGRTRPETIRIIIVPETMDVEWAKPLEAK